MKDHERASKPDGTLSRPQIDALYERRFSSADLAGKRVLRRNADHRREAAVSRAVHASSGLLSPTSVQSAAWACANAFTPSRVEVCQDGICWPTVRQRPGGDRRR
jgi:hypothetical protein